MITSKNITTGRAIPIKNMLVNAISVLKRRSSRHSNSYQRQKFVPGANEIVNLGKLFYRWEEIVGAELYSKVWPERCFRKSITLVVKDHQWLNTLTFFKQLIIKKISDFFPELKVKKIIAKVGKMPDTSKFNIKQPTKDWPDWNNESDMHFPSEISEELSELMARCRKKLNARVKGLKESGYFICNKCSSNIVYKEGDVCAVCQFKDRLKQLYKIRNILTEEPWIHYSELRLDFHDLSVAEFESIKLLLLQDTMSYIEQMGNLLIDSYNKDLDAEMRSEMVRAVVLITGETPDKIDLNEMDNKLYMSDSWKIYLAQSNSKENIEC